MIEWCIMLEIFGENTLKIWNKLKNFIENFAVDYYLEEFSKIREGKKSWNWSAFFFCHVWLMYRKMYAFSFASFCVFFSLVTLLFAPVILYVPCRKIFFDFRTYLFLFFAICFAIFHGFFGNRLYYFHLQKKKFDPARKFQPISILLATLCLIFSMLYILDSLILRGSDMFRISVNFCFSSFINALVYVIAFIKLFIENYFAKNSKNPISFKEDNRAFLTVKITPTLWICVTISAFFITAWTFIFASELFTHLQIFIKAVM